MKGEHMNEYRISLPLWSKRNEVGVRRYQRKDGTLTSAGKKRMKTFKAAADFAAEGKKTC